MLYRVLEGATADVTSQHIYSLSEGTRQILDRMSDEGVQPVEITLYFSETTGNTLPRFIKDFITYERYLRHLLRSYKRAAQGKIEVSFIDPFTDSDEAVEAVQDGLEGRAINQHGDQFFFGLTVETQTGSKDSIPFLWPEEQESVEYEISKRLTSLLWPGSKRIGILAGLEVFGTTDNPYLAQMLAAQGRQPSEKWISVRLLEESYQVSNLGTTVEHVSHDDYDLVIVIHPKDLGGKALWALDEWVVTGGKTLVFLDPYSIADPAPQDPQQPWATLQYEPASSLDPLLSAWGLEMPPRTFAADLDLAVRRPVVRGGASESVVVDLRLDGEGWAGSNSQSPVIQGLGDVRFFMAGVLRETGTTTLKRFSNRPCTTWGRYRGTSAHTDAGGPDACLFDGSARAGAPRQRCRDEGGRCGGEVPRERVVGAATETAAVRDTGSGSAPRVQRHGRRGMREPHAPHLGRADCGAPGSHAG